MKHLTDDQIFHLAEKVLYEKELTPEEEELLLHLTTCDECYYLMEAHMTMRTVADNIGKFACAVDK